jgi:hypothetical protein
VLIVGGSHGMGPTPTGKNLIGYQRTNRDIGLAVVFLMSDPYMTPQVPEIDGGPNIKV